MNFFTDPYGFNNYIDLSEHHNTGSNQLCVDASTAR